MDSLTRWIKAKGEKKQSLFNTIYKCMMQTNFKTYMLVKLFTFEWEKERKKTKEKTKSNVIKAIGHERR